MFLLVLAACGAGQPNPSAGETPVPLLQTALARRCPKKARGAPAPGDGGLHRMTLSGTGPKCNDGSTPVLYIRKATDPKHASDWIFHLEGGGSCRSYEECVARWCGANGGLGSKMTAEHAPMTMRAFGLQRGHPDNAFAGWNHARAFYCSSDAWSGQASDAVLDGPVPFRLHFMGASIVDAMVEKLARGATSDDGTQVVPALEQAGRLLFSGSSAGGVGVIANLDRVADRLGGVSVLGLVDGMFEMAPDVMEPSFRTPFEAQAANQWKYWYLATLNGTLDQSCAQKNTSDAQRVQCGSYDALLRQHLSTPFVIHHDLGDRVLFDRYRRLGMSYKDYISLGEKTFRLWESSSKASVHIANCGQHTWADNAHTFLDGAVKDADGKAWSLHDTVLEAFNGRRVVAIDGAGGGRSSCP